MSNEKAADAVLVKSSLTFDASGGDVRGISFDKGEETSLDDLYSFMKTTGFQATNVALAVDEINRMLVWEEEVEAAAIRCGDHMPFHRARCTIFLSFTSNMISSGVRETIKFLVKNKMVGAIVTSAGGIEEDIIKCLAPTVLGDFKLDGKALRLKGMNRLGNLIIPNANYCLFEDWVNPLLNKMTDEQIEQGVRWSPSEICRRLGKEINNDDSFLYWAYKNDIPVFSPAITDGSLGDMMYFHNYKRPEFVVDLVQDIRRINDIAMRACCTGMIILGGGVIKHHTCNANLMRNGAEYSVFINTGQEFDGSDSGASPDEAVSWGKIKSTASPVKVCSDATLVFPLIVSQTFVKDLKKREARNIDTVDNLMKKS
jgi:deoxyhypusine synthase